MKVEFFKHNIGPEAVAELVDTLNGVFLTTGPKTALFEERFAEYLGTRGAVGLSSWTQAAFLVLRAWGIGPGDEVIVPAMTFVATANIVLHCGATPVFVDSERETGNLDLARVEAAITPRTKAIIPVHLYGTLVDMKKLRALADRHGMRILEDAAHAIEARRDGYGPGEQGHAACFSFYATKSITAGEGGAVVSNDLELLEQLRRLRLHGMSRSAAERYTGRYEHWDVSLLGYKANMSDLQASLLLHQLAQIASSWKRRDELATYYETRFAAAGIAFPSVPVGARSARHLFTVWAPRGGRDALLERLQERQVGVAVNFRAVPTLTYYRERFGFSAGDFPVAEEIGDRTISLPLYSRLTDEEARYVADEVIAAFGDRCEGQPVTARRPRSS